MKHIYKVWSDNFDGDYLSIGAYEEVLLTMGTADYCLHRSKLIDSAECPSEEQILCFDSHQQVFYTLNFKEASR